jgi:hypothetical protein
VTAKQDEANRKIVELSRQMHESQNAAGQKIVDTLRPEQVEKLKGLMANPGPYIMAAPQIAPAPKKAEK